MFYFKYINNEKNLILFYKLLIFFILIKYNKYNSHILTIAKNSTYIISFFLFLTILYSYEFINIKDRINYHKFFSKIFVFYSLIHTLCHVFLITTNLLYNNVNIFYYFKVIYLTGCIIFFLTLIIFFLSLKIIRKKFFNIFFYTHYLVYLIVGICIFHSNYYLIFFLMLCFKPIYYFCFRNIKIYKNEILLINDTFILLKLFFKKNNKIKNGDCVYLTCKNISKLEKHPFTVIDSSYNLNNEYNDNNLIIRFNKKEKINFITLCISNNGNWKSKLISLFNNNIKYDLINHGLNFEIKSFYNTNIEKLKKFETIIFFCENIGVTSFLSFLNFLSKKINQIKIYNVILYLQMDNTKLLNLLEYNIANFKKIPSLNIVYNLYIKNEDVLDIITQNYYFNFFKGRINYNSIIKNLEDEKNICIYHCGDQNIFFKIKYNKYILKKKKIKIYNL